MRAREVLHGFLPVTFMLTLLDGKVNKTCKYV